MSISTQNWTFYFARINLLGLGYVDDRWGFLGKIINSDSIIPYGSHRYAFGEVTEESVTPVMGSDPARFISGWIYKYTPEMNVPTFDEHKHEESGVFVPRAIVCKAPFFVHVGDHLLIAYHPPRQKMSHYEFKKVFSHLVEDANTDSLVRVDILQIDTENAIMDALDSFSVIRKVHVIVYPPNPSPTPAYQPLADELAELELTRLELNGENELPRGINREKFKGSRLEQGIQMAADGYGTADITGISEGREVKVSTVSKNTVITKQVRLRQSLMEMLSHLTRTFAEVAKGKGVKDEDET